MEYCRSVYLTRVNVVPERRVLKLMEHRWLLDAVISLLREVGASLFITSIFTLTVLSPIVNFRMSFLSNVWEFFLTTLPIVMSVIFF